MSKKSKIAIIILTLLVLSAFIIPVSTQQIDIKSNFFNKTHYLQKEKIFSKMILNIESYGDISAGASKITITPDLSKYQTIYLAGFDRNRKSTGVHDDIWARCCCLRIGDITMAIVSVDLIGVMYHEYLSILEQLPSEISIDLVLLTSTHNHEGPDTLGLWGEDLKSGITVAWYQEAIDRITDCISDAYEKMQPAGILFGHTNATGLSRDSRKPHIIEEQIETIQVIDKQQKPITTLVFFASHPEVLWDDNTLITSDYPHYLYQYIEKQTNSSCQLITGPIGGLITPNTESHTFKDAQYFGETIGNLSLTSIQKQKITWNTKISLKSSSIFIPMTNPIFRLASILNILERPLYYCRTHLKSMVNVIEMGNQSNLAQIITVPGEDFPENWFEIKEKLHATHKIHIGLCNDELGYIVPFEDFDVTDYEESMSASRFLDPIIHLTIEEMLTIK